MTPRPCDILAHRDPAEAMADWACCGRSDEAIAENIAAIQKLGWRLFDLVENIGTQFEFHQEQRAIHNCQAKPAAAIVRSLVEDSDILAHQEHWRLMP
jgi:hypothetical protein